MSRLALLLGATGVALALNLAPDASAQEAEPIPVVDPTAPEAPPVDPYGPPLYGTRGNPWVGLMQTWLRDNGFRPGPSDWWFGVQTERAVKRFQTAAGLEPTGEWTWETSQAQQSYVAPPEPSVDWGKWAPIIECESGGDWSYNGSSGYDGALQIHPGTWRGFGGRDFAEYAWQATPEQQIIVAERILAGQGWRAWPVCSRRAGYR